MYYYRKVIEETTMDYIFKNICKFDEIIVGDFYKVWYKQHNFFIKRIFPILILFTVAMSGFYLRGTLGPVLSIVLYFAVVILCYVMFSKAKNKQIQQYLKTTLKLNQSDEVHYVFDNHEFGIEGGKKYKYSQLDLIVFSDKLAYFNTGNVTWIFPRNGFSPNNYVAFQEFIFGNIESNKIRYIL